MKKIIAMMCIAPITMPVGMGDSYADSRIVNRENEKIYKQVKIERNADRFYRALEEVTIENAQKRIAEEKRLEEIARNLEIERKNNVNFNPYNLLERSRITGDELYILLKDTGMSDVSWALAEAENTYGVNAMFLTGLVALESYWGESERATGWTNNMTGMDVPSDYSVGTVYASRSECVLDTARQLKQYYLTDGGNCYNGVSIWDVNSLYSVSGTWSDKIINISSNLVSKYHSEVNV